MTEVLPTNSFRAVCGATWALQVFGFSFGAKLGTTSVQLSERKSGSLVPKRHQMKHLEF